MSLDGSFVGKSASPKKMSVSFYLIVGIVLVIIAIFLVLFSGLSSDTVIPAQSNSNISIASSVSEEIVEVIPAPISMKPVQSLESVVSFCDEAGNEKNAEAFCLDLKKVDFDGLEVFINCEDDLIKEQVSAPLSCSGQVLDVTLFCSENSLSDDEFVSDNRRIATCAEFKLG